MKKVFLNCMLLLCALIVGSSSVWATDPSWSHTFASQEAISENSITVNGATWSVATTAGEGSPTISTGTYSSTYGLKFGSSKSVYFGSVTFSTSYFNSYNVKSVTVNILNNGNKQGTLTAQQGSTSIGSTSQTFGQTWTNLTVNTNSGSGGTLSFTYSVEQAFYIHSITVVYESPAPAYTITAATNNSSYGTVSLSGSVITATPYSGYRISTSTPYSVSPANSATVSRNGNAFTVTPSADCTVTINFEAIPTYEVTINAPTGGTLSVMNGETPVTTGDEIQDGTVLTITANPDADHNFKNWQAVDASTHTYTASNTGTYTINGRAVTFNANFDAKVYHDAYFLLSGGTQYAKVKTEKGQAIDFPDDPDDVGGRDFVGWVASEIDGTTNTAPTFVTSANMGDADVTYYACYASVNVTYSESEIEKTQTLQYDTWTYSGSTTNKSTYRLFHTDSYIESAAFDLSLLKKVVVKGGTYGGASYNSLTIGDGTNVWKDVTVSGNKETGNNEYTGGTALSGTKALRVISNSGTADGTGVRISQVEIYTKKKEINYEAYCTTVTATISLNATCTDGKGNYYATYSNSSAFIVPEGITVSAVKITDGHLDLSATYSTGDVVAANTGVLITSTSEGNKTVVFTATTGTTIDGNLLHPGGVDADGMAAAAPSCKYYKLALQKNGETYVANTAGFYWGADQGAAFTSGANKAYLAVPTTPSNYTAPSAFRFTDEENNATSINDIEASDKAVKFIENGQIYILRDGITYDALGRKIR